MFLVHSVKGPTFFQKKKTRCLFYNIRTRLFNILKLYKNEKGNRNARGNGNGSDERDGTEFHLG